MKKKDKEIISYIFSNRSKREVRRVYFENDFLFFCFYYFPLEFIHTLADFQIDYIESLEDGLNIFFAGFRECWKSTILTLYYTYVICYRKRKFIMHYNSEIEQSRSMLRDVIVNLEENEKLIRDFGFLYIPEDWKKKRDKKQKSVWEFVTENWVKMKAMSIWKSPRWQKFVFWWITYRPDLIWFDDLDTNKNTKNPEIINNDINFILWEVFGWASSYCQFIFLWNVINEIWRIPSLKKHFEANKNSEIKIFWIPIRQKWKIVWDRFVATDKIAEEKNKKITNPREKFISLETKRRLQWLIWYNQNYNLIPYIKGQRIISDSMIQYYQNLPKNYKVVIGVDPAFSEKTGSDAIWITVTAHENYNKENYKYVIEMIALEWEEKDEERFCKFIKILAEKYNYSVIYIENNNWWGVLARMLKKRNLSVIVINSEKDKVTRLREFQWEIERWLIKFNSDNFLVWKWLEQLKLFPNSDHDDMVDSMVFSFNKPVWASVRILW